MKKAAMIVTDGFEELEAVGAYDILTRGGVEVDIFTLAGTQATGKCGLVCAQLAPVKALLTAAYDALILPGGPQFEALKNDPRVKEIIADFHRQNKILAAICASPVLFGEMGLLKDKKYTCFPPMDADFGGQFTGNYAETDGNIVTGQSAAAAVDFGLAVLESLCGPEAAQRVQNSIFYK